jgi:hypothetical protein
MIARFPRLLLSAIVSAALLCGVAACGKKGSPKPPEGQESEYTYPQAYPAPSTVVPQPDAESGPLSIFRSDKRSQTKTY